MAFLAVAGIIFMALATVADVARRTFEGESIAGVLELGEVMMVAITFLGLAYAEYRGAHVSMTLVVRRIPRRIAAVINAAGLLLIVVVVAWMFLVTFDRAVESYAEGEYRFGLVQVAIWPARIAIVVGLAAYLIELVFRLVDDVRLAAGGGGSAPGPGDESADTHLM